MNWESSMQMVHTGSSMNQLARWGQRFLRGWSWRTWRSYYQLQIRGQTTQVHWIIWCFLNKPSCYGAVLTASIEVGMTSNSVLRGVFAGHGAQSLNWWFCAIWPMVPMGQANGISKNNQNYRNFWKTHTHMDAEWGEMVPLICMERKMEEPTNPEDNERLFNSLKHMENFHSKGPLIKLARWFSIFQSLSFFQGDLFATKFVIQQVDHGQAESEPDDNKPMPDNIDDYKKELNALKKRKGSWKLAPSLVTKQVSCSQGFW